MDKQSTLTLPHEINVHVGGRVRAKRVIMGISQDDLGKNLGITFQQIQKYERGTNRISASSLYGISQALQESVGYFFSGLPGQPEFENSVMVDNVATYHQLNRDVMELVKLFYKIEDPVLRRRLKDVVRSLIQDK